MSLNKSPTDKAVRNRRIPNAFMIFVKEQKNHLVKSCPNESKAVLGAFLGRKWQSMPVEEKQIYFDKYKVLKALKTEEPDSSSKEKLTENKNTNKCDIEDLSMKICSPNEAVVTDKPTTDETFKNFRPHSTSSPNVDGLSVGSETRNKPFKKARRPPNAFMLFAQEQRQNIDSSIRKDKAIHLNSVLGNMWQLLPNSEKASYFVEAKRLMNLYKKTEAESIRRKLRKKNKLQVETNPENFVGRSRMVKKEFLSSKSTDSKWNPEIISNEKIEFEANSSKPIDKIENTAGTSTLSGTHTFNENPNSNTLPHYESVRSQYHPLQTPVEPRCCNPCCCWSPFSSDFINSLKHNLTPDAGVSASRFGAGSFAPIFPYYQFRSPFWMYHQNMAHPMFPFSSPPFYPYPFQYDVPYSYNSAYNNAFTSSYMSGYSTRIVGPSSYTFHPSTSTTASSAKNEGESTEDAKRDENSVDEQLVVDEELEEKQRLENTSA